MNFCTPHQMYFKDWCPSCSDEKRRGGQRTDFSTWDRAMLEKFAQQAADENVQLRESVAVLQAAWRKAVTGAV